MPSFLSWRFYIFALLLCSLSNANLDSPTVHLTNPKTNLDLVVLWITGVKLSFEFHGGFSVVFVQGNQLIILLGVYFWHHVTICMSVL